MGEVPLRTMFSRLYCCCREKDILVKECWDGEELSVQFNRPFVARELADWELLVETLRGAPLHSGRDTPVRLLEKSGRYLTKSMYRFFSFRGVLDKTLTRLWKSKLPMKLKIFLWMAFHERLQTGVALKQKKWKENVNCSLCNCPETANHILFQCVMARFVWVSFKEVLGWERVPGGLSDFFNHWAPWGNADQHLKLFIFAIVAWALWVTRNKIRIQKSFPRSPIVILYKINFFVQKCWCFCEKMIGRN